MGGVVKAIADAVSDVFEDVADAVSDVFEDVADTVGDVFEGIGHALKEAGSFVGTVLEGAVNNVVGVVEGIVTGDWVKARNSLIGIANTVIAGVAAVFGGPAGWAAGAVMLDAQYNQGHLLSSVIATVGDVEEKLFGTSNIHHAAMEIQAGLTFAASVYSGYVAAPIIIEALGLAEAAAAIPAEIKRAATVLYYGQDIYQTARGVIETREYYEAMLAEYEAKLSEWLKSARAAKELWFDIFLDTEMMNRVMPGGDLYNSGPGSYYYSPTSVHEGVKYMFSLEMTADMEMDNLITGRIADFAPGGDGYIYTVKGA